LRFLVTASRPGPDASASSARLARPLYPFLALFVAMLGSACSTIDTAFPERGFAVNVASANVREDAILLNIVRASRFEPMNFVTLSKYNGSGLIEGGVQATRNNGLIYDVLNSGPVAAGTTATTALLRTSVVPSTRTNSAAFFDLASLENKEFYAGFLAQLDLSAINLLVNAGLSRELVLHSIVKAARVTRIDNNIFHYHNDPTNDAWNGVNGPKEREQCEALQVQRAYHPPFVHPVWSKPHVNDCNYQKFLYLLRAALAYGMTTETREFPKAAGEKGQATSKVVLCFDPAIAQEYGKTVDPGLACGTRHRTMAAPRTVYGDLGRHVKAIQPVLRSPYSVFQYYGRLLATGTVSRVQLIDAQTPRLPTGDNSILTIKKEEADCFAHARHLGVNYCVPNKGANNTKEIFVLLNALVNLSTTRSSLPTTPTVQLAPQ
jgi:hypothetical protein